jgi:hypothetical protein
MIVAGKLMSEIKIAVSALDKILKDSNEHIWYGILKRERWDQKHTLEEWKEIINQLKSRPAN